MLIQETALPVKTHSYNREYVSLLMSIIFIFPTVKNKMNMDVWHAKMAIELISMMELASQELILAALSTILMGHASNAWALTINLAKMAALSLDAPCTKDHSVSHVKVHLDSNSSMESAKSIIAFTSLKMDALFVQIA